MEEHMEPPEAKFEEDELQMVSRDEWGATKSAGKPPLTTAGFLMYGHTKIYTDRLRRNLVCFNCTDTVSNKEKVKAIQEFDGRTYGDIRFNFLIGGDGKVYEGLGWSLRPSLPKKYQIFESKSLFIAMLEPLPDPAGLKTMLQTRKKLLKFGVINGFIKSHCTEITMNNKYFWPQFRNYISRP